MKNKKDKKRNIKNKRKKKLITQEKNGKKYERAYLHPCRVPISDRCCTRSSFDCKFAPWLQRVQNHCVCATTSKGNRKRCFIHDNSLKRECTLTSGIFRRMGKIVFPAVPSADRWSFVEERPFGASKRK